LKQKNIELQPFSDHCFTRNYKMMTDRQTDRQKSMFFLYYIEKKKHTFQ